MGAQQSLTDMEQRFARLWQRLLPPATRSDYKTPWRDLEEGYCEAWRQYHNGSHLAFCMREFDEVRPHLNHPDEVEMALWFHDAVIDPEGLDNEARSAQLYMKHAGGLFPESFNSNVCKLILATTHDANQQDDVGFLCDIDLASLGLSWDYFLDDGIRLKAESPKPRHEYAADKLRFFQGLLQREHIYMTGYFRQRYENSARDNIQRMMALLETSLYC